MRRLFAIGGPPAAVATMGVDDGTTNPVAGTSQSTPTSTNRRLIAFDSTATYASPTVTAAGTYTQANANFVHKRLFLSNNAAGTTDAAATLYAMTNVFTVDLTAFSTFSVTYTATTTGTGS